MDLQPYPITIPIERNEQGVFRIAGTRVRLASILYLYNLGKNPDEIVDDFPTVSLPDVFAVITYYLHNRAEVDSILEEEKRVEQAHIEDIGRKYANPSREEMMARLKQKNIDR
jgi:uncharacterized protein (DUF433 family)